MRLIKTLMLITILTISLMGKEQVNVNFSNLQISDFIKLVSKITHTNILLNNRINGTVNFVSTTPIYDDELMGILISVLNSKGFTLIKKGSIYEVIRSVEAARSNVAVAKKGRKVHGAFMLTQAIKIRWQNVDIVAAKIRYLLSRTAKLITMRESNTLLITDYPQNIETIKKVIQNININAQAIVKVIMVKHTDAKNLQRKLLSISKTLFNKKIAYEKVQILLDDDINGLIVVGLKKNVKTIEDLVLKLDIKANNSKSVKVFELKNSDAKSVLTSLNAIVAKQVYPDPSMKPNISASEEINSIIVVGKPIMIKAIKQIIDMLDKEKYQVYVQARIININRTNSENIGVKYGFAAGDVSPSGLYAMSANFGAADTLTATASNGILDFLGKIGSATKSGLALGATLDFLQSNGAAKEISNPSILCVNNKESSIYVGKTISISDGSTSNAASGTIKTYKREDVGLTLKIKPRVSLDDKVGLEVETILGSVLDPGSATTQPVTSKQTVKTEVILNSGESIIIGGLFKKTETLSKSQVPLLGDIPLVGKYLFSSNGKDISEDSLVVVLTPYVISKSEKLSKLQEKLGKLSSLQNKYDKIVFKQIEKKAKTKKESQAQKDIKNSIFSNDESDR